MDDKKYPMGLELNTHFGHACLPSQILEVKIFEEYIEFECEDGIYRGFRDSDCLCIIKVKDCDY